MIPGASALLVERGALLNLLWERLTDSDSDDGDIFTSTDPGAAGNADGDNVGSGRRGEEDSFPTEYFR